MTYWVPLLIAALIVWGGSPGGAAAAPQDAFSSSLVVERDPQGRPIIGAVHVPEGLAVDGALDEPLYRSVVPLSDFVQAEPNDGAPSTEKTELWIAYDDRHVYVAVRCWDSEPPSRWIANEMRRDSGNIPRNENVAVIFDTFHDRRNGVVFEVTPLGGIWDGIVTNERATSADWNPVWTRQAGRFEGGWTAEMAIPFKSLRYRPGADQTWGFNIRRTIRWKNEETFAVRMPRVAGVAGGAVLFQVSNAITITGLQAPQGSKNVEIKPYVLSSVTSDRVGRPAVSHDVDGDVGFDFKYGVTQNLTADFTYNTDFAQVEVDTQQVNLTRFSLFFPEKREFFLEGQGIFDFGGIASSGPGSSPLLFFSRRIGLNAGRAIPIDAGGRLTGRVGDFSLGAISVQASDDPASATPSTNFSVVRIKRDIMRRSSVGLLYTGRSRSSLGAGSAQTFGVDTTLRLHDLVTVNAYAAKTDTPGRSGRDMSHLVLAQFNSDRYGLELNRVRVEENFLPDVGFLQRTNYERTNISARFSPRPQSTTIRKYTYTGTYDLFDDGAGRMQTRDISAQFNVEMHTSDQFSARVTRQYEFLGRPFEISPRVAIAAGEYEYTEAQASFAFGVRRPVSGTVSFEGGAFYSGSKQTLTVTGGRVQPTARFSLEPGISLNWVAVDEGAFTSRLLSTRATFTFTPLMFLSGIVQFNSNARTVGSNLRLRWEYQPGSELFLVYTDELDTLDRGYPALKNRAFVAKLTRLLRF